MFDFIITLGQFVVGCLMLLFLLAALVVAGIEIYDRITGADEANAKTEARIKSIKDASHELL